MSGFRVTERSIASRSLQGLQRNLSKLSDMQAQLSGGKLLTRPSDSPIGTVSAMQSRGQIRAVEQYSRNADDGMGWLSTLDSTLNDTSTQLNKIRDLVLQGSSAGTSTSPGAREALGAEVDELRSSILNLANTRYLDRPVFGGTTTGSVAYAADGTYAGDTGSVTRTVGDNTKVRVDASGDATFGTGTDQLFSILSAISDNIRNNPGALGANLDSLDAASDRVRTQLTEVGARTNRIESAKDAAASKTLDLKNQLSDVEDIDLPKAITDLTLQQTAYQAALGATAKVVQPSLLDFLR
jgi:flagellar hook-associated protein 3 FlgL